MQKRVLGAIFLIFVLSFGIVSASWNFQLQDWVKSVLFDKKSISGKVVDSGMEGNLPPTSVGPSASEQACMMKCMQCESIGVNCKGNQQECMTKCNANKPESTPETSCMEKCILVGCGGYDFSCQNGNKDKCEKECNMIKEPEAKNEEEKCIRACVKQHSPGTICKPSQEGEQGNDVCKMCAQQCVHLYAGPCLGEEKLETKKKECMTCEHCYAKTVMGDSGEGWECIVDVECKDASSEFGDNPGIGEGIAKAVGNVGEAIGNVFEGIGDFFSGLFGGNDESVPEVSEDSGSESVSEAS